MTIYDDCNSKLLPYINPWVFYLFGMCIAQLAVGLRRSLIWLTQSFGQ
jgi:hypothetical protein